MLLILRCSHWLSRCWLRPSWGISELHWLEVFFLHQISAEWRGGGKNRSLTTAPYHCCVIPVQAFGGSRKVAGALLGTSNLHCQGKPAGRRGSQAYCFDPVTCQVSTSLIPVNSMQLHQGSICSEVFLVCSYIEVSGIISKRSLSCEIVLRSW